MTPHLADLGYIGGRLLLERRYEGINESSIQKDQEATWTLYSKSSKTLAYLLIDGVQPTLGNPAGLGRNLERAFAWAVFTFGGCVTLAKGKTRFLKDSGSV